jgi:hypothetical protein
MTARPSPRLGTLLDAWTARPLSDAELVAKAVAEGVLPGQAERAARVAADSPVGFGSGFGPTAALTQLIRLNAATRARPRSPSEAFAVQHSRHAKGKAAVLRPLLTLVTRDPG